jgi:hypothetical protein
MFRTLLLAGVAALSVLAATSAASATQMWCAVVLKPPARIVKDKDYNPDQWLTLRETPSSKGYKIVLLREGDYLTVGSEKCWEDVCDTTPTREWRHVVGIPRFDGKDPQRITFGWVRRKYIQEFLCPENQAEEAWELPPPEIKHY